MTAPVVNQIAKVALNNATLTTTGSKVVSLDGGVAAALFLNILGAPTGTLPTLQFSLVEVDPIDQTTALGGTVTSASYNAAGHEIMILTSAYSGMFKITWTLGGTTPSFSGVNASIVPIKSADTSSGGSATSAKQDTGNTSLSSIDAKTVTPAAAADAQALPTASWYKALLFGNDGSGGGNPLQMLRAGLTTISSTFTGMLNMLPWALYHSTPVTRSNGQGGPLETDTLGSLRAAEQFAAAAEDGNNGVFATMVKPLAVSTYCATLYAFLAANATKANIKASPANVFSLIASNANASTRYLQLHNKTTAPVATDVPLVVFAMPAATTLVIGREWFSQAGVNFSLGLGWAVSTTIATFTDSATAADHTVQVQYL